MMEFIDSRYIALPFYLRVAIMLAVIALIGIASWKTRQLTLSGLAAACIMGGATIFLGGFTALLFYMFFFISAALIGKASKKIRGIEKIQRKGGRRDAMQVLANGGAALLALVLYYFSKESLFLMVFAASLSEAAADTWSGDIGVLSKQEPVSIITMKRVPRGLSGGVSLLGTSAGLLCSVLFGLLYLGNYPSATLSLAAICAAASFAGCLIDSFLGGSVQAHYYDEKSDMLTEHPVSKDGRKLPLARGIRFFDNDMVNLTSNIVTFLLAWGMSYMVL